jgi:hypothetical protein
VDPAADLALLRAPTFERRSRGLRLSVERPRLGEGVVVLGYPYVGGSDPTLTVERGDITATERSFEGKTFIQTNANVNPGNSGGPMIDGCGRVVGVVVAKSTTTDRTNLVIPAEKVQDILRSVSEDHDPASSARARLDQFLSALAYQETTSAAGYLSRKYVSDRVEPLLARAIRESVAKYDEVSSALARRGINLDTLPEEQYRRVLGATLAEMELFTIRLATEVKNGRLSGSQASRLYFATMSRALFGRVVSHRIEQIKVGTGSARAVVELKTERGGEVWVLDLVREWGDWLISGLSRA